MVCTDFLSLIIVLSILFQYAVGRKVEWTVALRVILFRSFRKFRNFKIISPEVSENFKKFESV